VGSDDEDETIARGSQGATLSQNGFLTDSRDHTRSGAHQDTPV